MTKYPTVCEECAAVFQGGPKSHFCPECIRARQSTAARQRGLSQMGCRARWGKPGEDRKGSTGVCRRCGGVIAGCGKNRKYCTPCAAIADREAEKQRSGNRRKKERPTTDTLSLYMRHFRSHGYGTYGRGYAAMEAGLIPRIDMDSMEQEDSAIRKCPVCGKLFPATRRDRIYCSDVCRIAKGKKVALEKYHREKKNQTL